MKMITTTLLALVSLAAFSEIPTYDCSLENENVLSYSFDYEINLNSLTLNKDKVEEIIDIKHGCYEGVKLTQIRKENADVIIKVFCKPDSGQAFSVEKTLKCEETYLR